MLVPRARKRLIALVLSTSGGLVLAELAVRASIGAPMAERLPLMTMRANPRRGWEMVPGTVHYTYLHRVEVNSLGLRGPELPEAKREGERRVLYLGDSLVYGQGVAEEDTQPRALERALRERDPGRHWTVVNAGHRAYGTAQELGLLEELGPRIAPDLVLLGWYWNDVNERDVASTFAKLEGKGELCFDTGDRLEGAGLLRWHGRQLLRQSALVMLAHDLVAGGGSPYTEEYLGGAWQRTARHLSGFRARCAELGAHPLLVVIPDAHRIEGGEETRPFDERVLELARAEGLESIELLPALEELYARTRRLPVLPFDGHYDPLANRAMADHLAERLLASEPLRTE